MQTRNIVRGKPDAEGDYLAAGRWALTGKTRRRGHAVLMQHHASCGDHRHDGQETEELELMECHMRDKTGVGELRRSRFCL